MIRSLFLTALSAGTSLEAETDGALAIADRSSWCDIQKIERAAMIAINKSVPARIIQLPEAERR
jgi:hypothetical protein